MSRHVEREEPEVRELVLKLQECIAKRLMTVEEWFKSIDPELGIGKISAVEMLHWLFDYNKRSAGGAVFKRTDADKIIRSVVNGGLCVHV